MHVTSVESTELFTGPPDEPLQLVRVNYRFCSQETLVQVEGPGLETMGDVGDRENVLRATQLASAPPRPGTSEGRQLRCWLTQVLVTAKVVAAEAKARGLSGDGAPTEDELLPDVAARLEMGSVASSVLEDGLARAVFVAVTEGVEVSADEVADCHRRNPFRFACRAPAVGGWHAPRVEAVELALGFEHPGDPRQPDNTHKH